MKSTLVFLLKLHQTLPGAMTSVFFKIVQTARLANFNERMSRDTRMDKQVHTLKLWTIKRWHHPCDSVHKSHNKW